MEIISFMNQKGGVGKTTLTINIAAMLASKGKKVLIIDNDAQSNCTATFYNGMPVKTLYNVLLEDLNLNKIIQKTNVENLDIAINSLDSSDINLLLSMEFGRELKLKEAISEANLNYDYVLIDCNPSLDLSLVNALVASNEIIIPIDASAYSLTGLSNLTNFINKIRKINKTIDVTGFILNNIDRRTNGYKVIAAAVDEAFPNKLFKQHVGMNSIYSKMQFAQETIIDHKGNKAYTEIESLVKECIERW